MHCRPYECASLRANYEDVLCFRLYVTFVSFLFLIINRSDMDTTHEEADVVLVQQMLTVLTENPAGITVV